MPEIPDDRDDRAIVWRVAGQLIRAFFDGIAQAIYDPAPVGERDDGLTASAFLAALGSAL